MKTRFSVGRIVSLSFLLAAASHAAHAQASPPSCTVALVGCYDAAANYPTFLLRTAAGIDCGINFAACVRNQFRH